MCLLGVLLWGCERSGQELGAATEAAEPHLQSFARFDHWARRATQIDSVLRDRDALNEAAFAPIRHTRAIVAAWIELKRRHGLMLALPDKTALPEDPGWVAIRHPRLGPLRVAHSLHCPVRVPRWWRGDVDGPCVLISRRERQGLSNSVVVTVAFRVDG